MRHKSDISEAVVDFRMRVRKVWFADFSYGLSLKNCFKHSIIVGFSSTQKLLKNSEVNPSRPEDLFDPKEKREALTSSSNGICVSQSFMTPDHPRENDWDLRLGGVTLIEKGLEIIHTVASSWALEMFC